MSRVLVSAGGTGWSASPSCSTARLSVSLSPPSWLPCAVAWMARSGRATTPSATMHQVGPNRLTAMSMVQALRTTCVNCNARRPREGDKARMREKRERTTGGQLQAAGVRFPRAAGGGPLTSSPAGAAPHPTYGHGTRSAQRSAPVGCSGAELASPPCPRPEERHGSIRRPRAGPSEAARGGRGRPLAMTSASQPSPWAQWQAESP